MFVREVFRNIRSRTYRKHEYFLAEVEGLPDKLYAYTERSPLVHVNGKVSDRKDVEDRMKRMLDNHDRMVAEEAERKAAKASSKGK